MARQVYFDPYGMRQAGYDTGVQREMQVQDQTRRARAADWDYNYMAPLRLSGAQLENQYAQAALPYRINSLGINERSALGSLYDTEQARLGRYGELRGDYSPQAADQDFYVSGQYMQAPQYRAPYSQVLRQNADIDSGTMDPSLRNPASEFARALGVDPQVFMQIIGQMIGRPFTPQAEQSFDQYQTWDRSRQLAMDEFGLTQNRAQMEAAAANAATNAYNAQTLGYDRYNNRGNQNAMPGGYTGDEDGVADDF